MYILRGRDTKGLEKLLPPEKKKDKKKKEEEDLTVPELEALLRKKKAAEAKKKRDRLGETPDLYEPDRWQGSDPQFRRRPGKMRPEVVMQDAASGGAIEKKYAHGGSVRKTKLSDY